MIYSIETKLDINATQKEVWAVLADFNNVYTWAPTVTHSAGVNRKYQEKGAGRTCTIEGFGDVEELITQWQENHGFAYEVSDLGPLTQFNSHWNLQAVGANKTSITVNATYQLKFGVIGKLLHKMMMRKKLENGFVDAAQALKKRVETGELVRPLIKESMVTSAT